MLNTTNLLCKTLPFKPFNQQIPMHKTQTLHTDIRKLKFLQSPQIPTLETSYLILSLSMGQSS